jgi:hypothetical protein
MVIVTDALPSLEYGFGGEKHLIDIFETTPAGTAV